MPDKSKKTRRVLFVAVIITVCGIIGVFLKYKSVMEQPEKLLKSISKEANISLGNINHTATRDGVKEWSLEAETARYIAGKNQALFKGVSVVFFLKDQKELRLEADQGILMTDVSDMKVTGNVRVSRESVSFSTEELNYSHEERRLFTETLVTIKTKGLHLSAEKMTYELGTGRTVFKDNVEGTISEGISF